MVHTTFLIATYRERERLIEKYFLEEKCLDFDFEETRTPKPYFTRSKYRKYSKESLFIMT